MVKEIPSEEKILMAHDLSKDTGMSGFEKYKVLSVGEKGYLYLLKYEILQLLLSNIPGALGYLLRQKLFPNLFCSAGGKIVIGKGVAFRQPHKLSIGSGSIIEDYSRITIIGGGNASVKFGKHVFFGPFSVCASKNGKIEIDDHASISSHCRLGSTYGRVYVGKYTMVGAYCYIGGGNHSLSDLGKPMMEQEFNSKGGVEIEDDVWIGANVLVMDGVRIGKGSVIGACSLVNKDIPQYSIAYGIPAKVHGSRQQPENT